MAFLTSQGVAFKCLVLLGESIGSGVVIQIATEIKPGAIILQSPFPSLAAVAKFHYPWAPVKWFLKDRFDSIKKIEAVKAPILVLHGEKDHIVPIKFGKAIYQSANQPKAMQIYKDFGHNDISAEVAWRDILQFVSEKVGCQD